MSKIELTMSNYELCLTSLVDIINVAVKIILNFILHEIRRLFYDKNRMSLVACFFKVRSDHIMITKF